MGEGGRIRLFNLTPCPWVLNSPHSYQMNAWTFPDSLAANTYSDVYVEWDQGIFKNAGDDAGEAPYTVQCPEGASTFQIQARAKGGFNLQVYFDGLSSPLIEKGFVMNLGWVHDGAVTFVLFQHQGNFFSNPVPYNWMQYLLPQIGQRTLKQISLAGTHDAGMGEVGKGTALVNPCNLQTQAVTIGTQLAVGARYFDIRPVVSGAHYFTGHYDAGSKLGANGQSFDDIINEINGFTDKWNELIILDLTHDLDTDNGYVAFNQDQYNGLLSKLYNDLRHLHIAPAGTTDLTARTVNDYISGGPAVVVIVRPDNGDVTLGSFAGQGLYTSSQFTIHNDYSDTNKVDNMANDQLQQLASQTPANYFLLSWTLTQDRGDQIGCTISFPQSIEDYAAHANGELWIRLVPARTTANFPNIILVDYIGTSNAIGALAIWINIWLTG